MTAHVEDGALVRYLDGEAAAEERTILAAHLEDCGACAARLTALSRAAEALTTALRATDEPASRARPHPRWRLRAAAAVLVLLAVGGGVRPVRAWILDRAEALWGAVTGAGPDAAPPVAAPGAARSSVAFVPAGGELTLEVTSVQNEGVLQIETVAGDTAVAVVRNGTSMEDLVVLPTALRIVNRPASTASYVIRVPARLARVVVHVGDTPEWVYRPGTATREIDLRNR